MAYIESDGTERLENPDNFCAKVEHKKLHNGGRKVTEDTMPHWLRVTIGTAANISGPKKASDAFGVSYGMAKDLKDGRTASHVQGKENLQLVQDIGKNIEKARDITVSNLLSTLGLLPDKLNDKIGAKDLAGIAKDLSTVVSRLTPGEGGNRSAVTVNLYAPRVRSEKEFEIIDVRAEAS